jgi:hypothetical protein
MPYKDPVLEAAYKERRRRDADAFRERHPGVVWVNNLKRYGLTPASWTEMLIAQCGRCACCRDPMRVPIVDHDHETGRVRGLLCGPCNLILGHAKDDAQRLLAIVEYLRSEDTKATLRSGGTFVEPKGFVPFD